MPTEPQIAGKVAFLTGGGPTAGMNGNICRVSLPTGSTVIFAGIRVGHDEVLDTRSM